MICIPWFPKWWLLFGYLLTLNWLYRFLGSKNVVPMAFNVDYIIFIFPKCKFTKRGMWRESHLTMLMENSFWRGIEHFKFCMGRTDSEWRYGIQNHACVENQLIIFIWQIWKNFDAGTQDDTFGVDNLIISQHTLTRGSNSISLHFS